MFALFLGRLRKIMTVDKKYTSLFTFFIRLRENNDDCIGQVTEGDSGEGEITYKFSK